MPPLFNSCLINEPYGDPGIFVSFPFNKRAIAFDLGDIYNLSPRDILKISHIFITHTHMDHFVGFDRLLRIILGRDQTLYLYGPEGFLKNIEGKLAAYSWNLVKNFANPLVFIVSEITKSRLITQEYVCDHKFLPTKVPVALPLKLPLLHEEPSLQVSTVILDHGIPSLGFALKEKIRINIRKDALAELGLLPGPWVYQFKQALFDNQNPDTIVNVLYDKKTSVPRKQYKLKNLEQHLVAYAKGQKIAYIADVAYTASNVEKIIKLANGADHLYIESGFLEKDLDHATRKFHLTARQAGEIAGLAGAKRFTLFHFSPRYTHAEKDFYNEATDAYIGSFKEQ
jgi:ribonuclease Z